MKNYVEKDCFVLEISVSPGGMRLGEIYIYAKHESIYNTIKCFVDEPYAKHILVYGATLDLYVIKNGNIIEKIDLYDYIKVHFYGYKVQKADSNKFFEIAEEIQNIADGIYEFEELQDEEMDLLIQKSGFDLSKLNPDTFPEDFFPESPLHKVLMDWKSFKKKLDAVHFDNPLKMGEKMKNKISTFDFNKKATGYFFNVSTLSIGAYDVESNLTPNFKAVEEE